MEIKLYNRANCPTCQEARQFLQNMDIDYEEIDITTDLTYEDELLEISGQTNVPVFDIDGYVIVGFNRQYLINVIKELS